MLTKESGIDCQMELKSTTYNEKLNILLVGNNPTEVGDIYDRLKGFTNPYFVTDVAFDFQNIFKRILKFKPYSILIDDRFNKTQLNRLIKRIHRNPKTMNIPVTVIKSLNRDLGIVADVDNYIMKANLTADNLRSTILASQKLRKTSRFLYFSYKRSLGVIQKVFLDIKKMYWFTEKL